MRLKERILLNIKKPRAVIVILGYFSKKQKIVPKKLPKKNIWHQKWTTWATFPKVSLHKNHRTSLFDAELKEELKNQATTNTAISSVQTY